MAVALLNDAQIAAPAAAANVTLTPSGSAWTNSAWVQLTAATASASILTGLVLATNWGDSSSIAEDWEVDIGTGAASSEVRIATFKGRIVAIFGQNPDLLLWIPTVVGIDNIASGARLSARIRTSSTNVTTWNCAVTYLAKPLNGTILTTAQPTLPLPSAAAAVALTANASAWVSGTWVQVRAATGAALVVVAVVISMGSNNVEYEFDLGTGGAGAETVITTIRTIGDASNVIFGVYPLWNPLDNIAAGVRVAARVRASTGSAAGKLALVVIEKPL